MHCILSEPPLVSGTVYATMRDLSRGRNLVEAAGRTLGRTLEIKQLDVCDETSIKRCVDSLPERRVDILSEGPTLGHYI